MFVRVAARDLMTIFFLGGGACNYFFGLPGLPSTPCPLKVEEKPEPIEEENTLTEEKTDTTLREKHACCCVPHLQV